MALLSLVPLLAGCLGVDAQNTFAPAGDVGRRLRDLFYIVLWPALGIFIVVEGLLLLAVLRFRHRPGGPLPRQVHGNLRLEIAWTIAPAILLLGIAVPTLSSIFALAEEPPPAALQVNVTAHQWWWQFEYPQLGITTANELHIPTNRKVALSMTSGDVIHSFWVPRLAGKADAIPGRVTKMWLNATKPSDYYSGQCAEFCGLGHALMRFRVVAQPESEFQAWVKAQQAGPATPTGDAARGSRFFAGSPCAACHTVDGLAQGTVGPNLTHLASRSTIVSGLLENTSANLTRWLTDPQAVKAGAKMPVCAETVAREGCTLALTQQQIADLVAFLGSLK